MYNGGAVTKARLCIFSNIINKQKYDYIQYYYHALWPFIGFRYIPASYSPAFCARHYTVAASLSASIHGDTALSVGAFGGRVWVTPHRLTAAY